MELNNKNLSLWTKDLFGLNNYYFLMIGLAQNAGSPKTSAFEIFKALSILAKDAGVNLQLLSTDKIKNSASILEFSSDMELSDILSWIPQLDYKEKVGILFNKNRTGVEFFISQLNGTKTLHPKPIYYSEKDGIFFKTKIMNNENLSTWTNTLLGLNSNIIIRKTDTIKPEREVLLKKDLVKFFMEHGYTAHIIQLDDMEFQIILNNPLNPQDLKKWTSNINQLKDLNIENAFSNPLLFIGAGNTEKDIRWTYLIRYAESGHFIFGRSIIEDEDAIYEDLSLWTKTLFCANRVWVKISPSGRLHRVAVLESVRTFLRKFGEIINTQEIPQGWVIWMDRDVSLDDLFMQLPEAPITVDSDFDRSIPDCLLDFSTLTLDSRITEVIGANWNINYGITG